MFIGVLLVWGFFFSTPNYSFITAAYADAAGAPPVFASLPLGGIQVESPYSRILVRDKNNRRSLYFVRDSGQVVLETSVNMKNPHHLIVPYTQVMMGAFLIQPKASKSLMIGVGGGAMIHHLQKEHPDIVQDAVDIDPKIIALAEKYFAIKPSSTVRLHAADGFTFIENSKEKYDIIFMDAFLKPSVDTDPTGTHLRLKTLAFYQKVIARLDKNGVVAFNINQHPSMGQDIETIRQAFQQVWIAKVPKRGNTIVFASLHKSRPSMNMLQSRAKQLDKTIQSISFQGLVGLLSESR